MFVSQENKKQEQSILFSQIYFFPITKNDLELFFYGHTIRECLEFLEGLEEIRLPLGNSVTTEFVRLN